MTTTPDLYRLNRLLARCLLTAVILTVGSPVSAQVSLWADTWPAEEENGDGTVTLYGTASASSSEFGDLLVAGWIDGPAGTVTQQSDSCYCMNLTVNLSTPISAASPSGDYTTKVAAMFNGEHYGCVFALSTLSSGNWYYEWLYEIDQNWARYARCNPGNCEEVRVRKSYFGGIQGWPPYARLSIVSITVLPLRWCFAIGGVVAAGCFPD
jgi:hypothetical protein